MLNTSERVINSFSLKRFQQPDNIPYDGKQGGVQNTVVDHDTESLPRPATMQYHWNLPVEGHSRDLKTILTYSKEFRISAELSSAVFTKSWLFGHNLRSRSRKLWVARGACRRRSMYDFIYLCWFIICDGETTWDTMPEGKMKELTWYCWECKNHRVF